jgi:thymidylate kinase|tara:strand:+ start:248 stop:1006 length:759 start_codon:yes stop_codon:yes gene_type:complete
MRIAICGTANIGKSTLLQDFLQEWDMYGREVKTYRDVLNEKGLPHSKQTTKESQKAILDYMVSTLKEFKKGDKVIFDRCPLDNLVYSMWAMSQEDNDIDEDFIDECIPIVREALTNLDIIFFIPITKQNKIEIKDNGDRETDEQYIKEIDSFFKVLQRHYHENPQDNPFFPRDDSPALIEVFGSKQERMQMIKLYIDAEGDLVGGDSGSDIFNPENLDMMEKLLESQNLSKKDEDEFKDQLEKIKNLEDLTN